MKTKAQKNLAEMLRIKAKKDSGSLAPCFRYEGRVLDTSTVITELCKYFEQQVAQESGGVK